MNNITSEESNITSEIPQNNHLLENESLSIKTLIAITILLIYIVSGKVFQKIKFNLVHESGLCMLLGMFVSGIAYFFFPYANFSNSLKFDDGIFFTFILPPIIFSAGYNMHCKNFFRYFHYAIIFGIFGTFITFCLTVMITSTFNYINFFRVDFTFKDILLFSSVISATDTVSPLALISEENQNKLFEVLFGEGIMNDSFSIVLYQIITRFYNIFTSMQMITYFIFLFFSSCILGILVGFICSIFLKYMKIFKLQRFQEISIIIIFAFISYTTAEILDLSAIISLLFCSISLSNYAFYNLSFPAREESCIVAKLLSSMAEAFVFTYLGLSFFTMAQSNYSLAFVLVEFFAITFARYSTVYILTGLTNMFSDSPFTVGEKQLISIAGCIRGAIAFGLAMSFETGDMIKDSILLSTTLILVFVTTMIFGAWTPIVSKKLYAENSNSYIANLEIAESYYPMDEENVQLNNKNSFKYEHPNNMSLSREENYEGLTGLSKLWFDLDRMILKPFLVDDWENCFKEHIDLSKKIKKTMNE